MVMPDLALQVRGDWAALVEVATFSEEAGLASLALPDHYLASRSDISEPAHDALIQMAALAHETESIDLCTLVSPVTFRHPAVTLKAATTIDDISGGRFTLGLGTGWFEEEHTLFGLPFPDRRFELLEEALEYTRAGLAGRAFHGEHYRIEAFDMAPRPALRLVVGGSGPHRTPELAGRFAHEFNVYAAPLDEMRARIAASREAAEAAGRHPSELMVSSVAPVITGTTRETYRSALELAAERFQRAPDALESSFRERGLPIGVDARDTIAAMTELGVSRFYLQLFGTDPERREDMLEALG